MEALYWGCPLTKIGEEYENYEKTIRVFLADACS